MVYECVVEAAITSHREERVLDWELLKAVRAWRGPWALLGVSREVSREFGQVLVRLARVDFYYGTTGGEPVSLVTRIPPRVVYSGGTVGFYVDLAELCFWGSHEARRAWACKCLGWVIERVAELGLVQRAAILVKMPGSGKRLLEGVAERLVALVKEGLNWTEVEVAWDECSLALGRGCEEIGQGCGPILHLREVREHLDKLLKTECVATDLAEPFRLTSVGQAAVARTCARK